MADFKTSMLYLGIAAGVGFGVGRVTMRTGEPLNQARSSEPMRAKSVASARKKKLHVKSASHQAPGKVVSIDTKSPASETPVNAPSVSALSVKSMERPGSQISSGPESPSAYKASIEQPQPVAVASTKPVETNDAPPKVRIFNAYRTRTFWTPGPVASDTQNFTIFIEREEGKNPAFKPRVDWQVGSAHGTVWGDSSKKIQIIPLPPEAWRLNRPTVEVEIKVGAAQDGQDFVGSTETATVTIRSLSQALASKGGLVHISEASHQSNTGPGWVTSWNKVSPGAGTTTIYLAPGTNPNSLWPMLTAAADFKVEPGVMPQGPMEIFVSSDKMFLGIVAGKIPPQTRNLIQRNRDILLTYRGQPQDYLGALRGDAAALAERVKAKATGDTVILFRTVPGQPFGAVKRDLITIPNIEILRKEGIALFTKPVENVAYFAH